MDLSFECRPKSSEDPVDIKWHGPCVSSARPKHRLFKKGLFAGWHDVGDHDVAQLFTGHFNLQLLLRHGGHFRHHVDVGLDQHRAGREGIR